MEPKPENENYPDYSTDFGSDSGWDVLLDEDADYFESDAYEAGKE